MYWNIKFMHLYMATRFIPKLIVNWVLNFCSPPTQYTIALVGSFVHHAQNAESRKLFITQLPNLLHYKNIDIDEFKKVSKKTVRSLEIMQMTSQLSIFHKK